MVLEIFQQILLAVIFLFLSLIVFTFPGFGLLKILKISLDNLIDRYVVSTTLGLAAFTVLAYLLAAISLRTLIWLVPVLGAAVILKFGRGFLKTSRIMSRSLILPFILVLVFGMAGQLAVNVPSGLTYSDGVYFWSSHGHDGVWHLSLMEQMHRSVFPFQNPEYAGHSLQNYHFFVDLLMSELTRMFHFSNLDMYFRLMPALFSLLLGLAGFIFIKVWTKNEWAGLWGMVFIYFAGSFGYFLTIPRSHNLVGESIFWVSQTQSAIGNPPHMAAFIILTVFMFCLYKYLQQRTLNYFFMSAFLGGVLIEFKVYSGALVLGGLLVIALWELISRRQLKTSLLFLLTLLISLIIYLPNSVNSQDFILWQPWWFIRTMVVAPDRLNWLDLELKRQTYIADHNWKRVFQVEAIAFLIFLFGNLGMRFIGFWEVLKQLRQNIFKHPFELFFLSITAASFLLPTLFVQKGVAWNLIQFMQYFLLLFGFLAAVTVADLLGKLKSKGLKIFLAILIVILAVPTQIGLLMQFYTNKPLSKVSNEELQALEFLKNNTNENTVILTGAFDKYKYANFEPPAPIYSWYDTGYVSAFSGRRTLLADAEQVNIMGYQDDKLLSLKKEIFGKDLQGKNEKQVFSDTQSFFKNYHFNYVYLVYDQKFEVPLEQLPLKQIYKTDNVKIYQKI